MHLNCLLQTKMRSRLPTSSQPTPAGTADSTGTDARLVKRFLAAGATENYGMGRGDKGESRYRRAERFSSQGKFCDVQTDEQGNDSKANRHAAFQD